MLGGRWDFCSYDWAPLFLYISRRKHGELGKLGMSGLEGIGRVKVAL
jgi:hypothetical protein